MAERERVQERESKRESEQVRWVSIKENEREYTQNEILNAM